FEAVLIAVALRLAPGEETVAREHDAVASGIVVEGAPQHQRELESGTLPRHPYDAAAEPRVEFVELAPAVRAGGEGDGPVRMEVVDVRERKEGVQWRVDRRC